MISHTHPNYVHTCGFPDIALTKEMLRLAYRLLTAMLYKVQKWKIHLLSIYTTTLSSGKDITPAQLKWCLAIQLLTENKQHTKGSWTKVPCWHLLTLLVCRVPVTTSLHSQPTRQAVLSRKQGPKKILNDNTDSRNLLRGYYFALDY